MTNWSIDVANKSGILIVEGDMTINHISDIRDRLIEAFASAERVIVDVSQTTAIDVAGVQLLCACHRFSVGCDKKMCLRLGGNTRFIQFLDEAGFARDFICDHGNASGCLWTSSN